MLEIKIWSYVIINIFVRWSTIKFKLLLIRTQLQVDREKSAYDFESLQSQLDKALGQAARLQKERDTAQLDADRFRDKHDKAQVSY